MNYFLKINAVTCLTASAMLTALCLFNQLVLYPALKDFAEDKFIAFNKRISATILKIFLPLMVVELICFVIMIYTHYSWPNEWILSAFFMIVLWAMTYYIIIKIHKKLDQGKHEKLIGELLTLNWFRTLIWFLKTILLILSVADLL